MSPLPSPDRFHVSAAIGWLELGNATEAGRELDRVAPVLQNHPVVLGVRYQVHARAADWDAAFQTAGALVRLEPEDASHPISQAYAARRMNGGGLPRAWEILRPAADRFPAEPIVTFNLACYACQMGRLDEAKEWLARAIASGGDAIVQLAREEDDLRPLRDA